jgi:hypothetical protein
MEDALATGGRAGDVEDALATGGRAVLHNRFSFCFSIFVTIWQLQIKNNVAKKNAWKIRACTCTVFSSFLHRTLLKKPLFLSLLAKKDIYLLKFSFNNTSRLYEYELKATTVVIKT